MDINLKRNAEYLLQQLKPIALALDKLQSNSTKIADAVYVWKNLAKNYTGANLLIFNERYRTYMTSAHFAAYLLSPRYTLSEIQLTQVEHDMAMSFIEDNFSLSFPNAVYLKFKSQIFPFRSSIFSSSDSSLTDNNWWKSVQMIDKSLLKEKDAKRLEQLMTAVASSSGVERTFSKFGIVHSKLRNKLGVEKAAKLVFISQQLNS